MLTKSLFCSLVEKVQSLSFYTPSGVHIDVMEFAVGSPNQMDPRPSFWVCPELFRQDPMVFAERTFGHASIPKRLEDVLGTGNQFSNHFFSQFGRRQGCHPSFLSGSSSSSSSSCSGTLLRHDGMMGLFSFVCFYVFLKCIVTMVLPCPNLVSFPSVSATLISTMSTTSLRRGMY